jgi:hypothetical protein
VLGGFTGPTGTFKQVNILGSFTGPTGTFPIWNQATGPTGSNGTFESVINVGPTGIKGEVKTVIIPGFAGGGGGGGGASQWNASDEAGTFSLSAVNLAASCLTTVSGDAGIRSTPFKTSGKLYAELTANNIGFRCAIGVAKSDGPLTGFDSGVSTHEAYVPQGGNIQLNGGGAGVSITGISTGTVICIAYDATNHRVWFRNGAGPWNGNVANDPGTNTGGLDVSAFDGTGLALIFFCQNVNDKCTMNTQGAFTQAVPSGFTAWN